MGITAVSIPVRHIFRFGHQIFRLMICYDTPDDLVERLPHHQRIAIDECNERIGTLLNIPDQLGVEDKLVSIEFCQTNHTHVVIGVICAEVEEFSNKNGYVG